MTIRTGSNRKLHRKIRMIARRVNVAALLRRKNQEVIVLPGTLRSALGIFARTGSIYAALRKYQQRKMGPPTT